MTEAEIVARLAAIQSDVEYDDKRHRYTRNGETYTGVTTALSAINKPALLAWAARLGAETGDPKAHIAASKEATGVGKEFHAIAEWWGHSKLGIDTPRPVASDQAGYLFNVFEALAYRHDFTPLAMEQIVYDDTHKYAGRFDLLARVDGRVCVPDYKTSSNGRVYPESILQNIAYRHCFQLFGLPIPDGLIVVIPKDGKDPVFHWVEDDVDEAFAQFVAALGLYRWLKKWD